MEYEAVNWRMPAPGWRTERITKQSRPTLPARPSMYSRNYFYDSRRSRPQCCNCKMHGHIAKFCKVQIKKQIKKMKTQRQKDRDHRRLAAFKSRKSVCAVMPFSDISDGELIAFMPKWCTMVQLSTKSKKVSGTVNVKLEAAIEVSKVQLENKRLCLELDNIKIKLDDMEHALCEKEDKIIKLQETIQEEVAGTEKLKRRIEKKEFLVGFLEEQFNNATEKAEKLERQLSSKKDQEENVRLLKVEIETLKSNSKGIQRESIEVQLENFRLQREKTELQDELGRQNRERYNSYDHGQQPSRRYPNRRR